MRVALCSLPLCAPRAASLTLLLPFSLRSYKNVTLGWGNFLEWVRLKEPNL